MKIAQAEMNLFGRIHGQDIMFVCFILFCQNFVVAVGAEGWFHLFDLSAVNANKADSSSQHEFTSFDDQKPLFTQHIPANTKVILISDIGECSFLLAAFCTLSLWIRLQNLHNLQMVMAAASWLWAIQTG